MMEDEMSSAFSTHGVIGQPEEKNSLVQPRREWKDTINKKFWEELIPYFP
jgi:hypothetical protein